MNRLKPTVLLICRIIIGVTFIFSGFVKAVDPLGSTYKFIDYFNAFGMGWANGLAFGLAVLQNVIEFTLGVMVLFNLRLRLSSALVLAFTLGRFPREGNGYPLQYSGQENSMDCVKLGHD